MNLKNRGHCADLRSENPLEAQALLTASMASYSPRVAGIMPNDDRMMVLARAEAEEFTSGVLRDVRLESRDKWAISKLIACWLSDEITDEGATL